MLEKKSVLLCKKFSLRGLIKELHRMSFEIPMYNLSGLQIKYLKIEETQKSKTPPNRWVRFITQSSSYVCRL